MTMPRTRRRLAVSGAVAAITALVLTGCGLGGGEAESGDDGSGDSAEAADQELTVWFPGNAPSEIAFVNDVLVPAFEEETGATVEATFVDWADISPKLNTSFAANTAPDVFGHGPAAAADFVSNDRVLALDDYIAELSEDDQADLQGALDAGIVDGSHYLVPLFVTGNVVVYRSDLLDEAGIDPATLTTWPKLRDAAETLTTADRSGLLLGTSAIADQQTFAMLLASAGGALVSDDGTEPAFASPEGVEALDFLVSLYGGDDPIARPIGDDYGNRPPAQQPLVTGEAAMTMLNPTQLGQIIDAQPELADSLGVLAPPAFTDGGQGKTFGGAGTGLFINSDSEHQDLAWKFLEFVSSPEMSVQYAEQTGNLPSRASAADSDYIGSSPQLQAFLEASPNFVPNPNLPSWVQVRDLLSQQLQLALAGQLGSQEALDAAAAEAAPLLGQ